MPQVDPKDTPSALDQMLGKLSIEQVRFVVARCEVSTDKEAAARIGIAAVTPKRWKRDGVPIEEVLQLMVQDGVTTALHLRRRHLAKAMQVKVAGLNAKNERLRQSVASEIIEWSLGRANQPVSGPGGGPIEVSDARDKLMALVAAQDDAGEKSGDTGQDDGRGSGDAAS